MTLLSFLQTIVLLFALIVSGEFNYIKQYAYNIFVEKNENRRSYVETMLTSKVEPIYDAAEDIVEIAEDVLFDMDAEAADIATDKGVNKEIIRRSAERLTELMRVSSVNDAYIILDSGELYSRDGQVKKSGFYLRDWEISSGVTFDNTDFLLEMGSADIAESMGISLDSGWSAQLNLDESMNFYYVTMATAKNYPDMEIRNLGHWTKFDSIAPLAQPSIKYTVPLISDDGVVFGVMGVGLLEKTLLGAIPSNDFFNKSSCYILCEDEDADGVYMPIIHSGAMYSRLVTDTTVISEGNKIAANIYDFNFDDNSGDTIGCISSLKLYNTGSLYLGEKWALVAMSHTEDILSIYYTILKTLFVSTIISIGVTLLFAIFITRSVTNPVKRIAAQLDEQMGEGSIIKFDPSGIDEIDLLTSSVTDLQVTVRQQASRVSKIISMADIGFGVFMYEPRNNTVFVGESLIKLVGIKSMSKEDTVLTREEFFDMVKHIDESVLSTVSSFMSNETAESDGSDRSALVEFYSKKLDKWIRCQIMSAENKVIGFFLDITTAVIEKKKMEYERDYDLITGLLNRRAYLHKIDDLFRRPEKLGVAAFIMCDLDNLKYVNDTYGHDYGDKYIQSAGEILSSFSQYGGIVSRLSGDEFNVFLYGFESKEQIRELVKSVWDRLVESYCLVADGTRYKLRASGGISWYPDDSTDYEKLMKYADFAMYTVKHSIKGTVAEFDIGSYNKDSILITGVEEMNRIIDEESVRYAFQSIVSAKTGEIYGYEALMRPQSEVFRSPLDFIRIAKAASRLHEVERLTWLNALKYFRELRDRGIAKENARVFINSLPDCRMGPDDVKVIEEGFGDLLDRIVLEILEGEQTNEVFMKAKQRRMDKWNAMIALDDFGCGYNSEYALITLGPDLIKIDRSIISGCDADVGRRNIILNLVSHAKMRNVLVLAEGVETKEEMHAVIDCGVDLIQGYYIDRPDFDPKPIADRIRLEIKEFNEASGEE